MKFSPISFTHFILFSLELINSSLSFSGSFSFFKTFGSNVQCSASSKHINIFSFSFLKSGRFHKFKFSIGSNFLLFFLILKLVLKFLSLNTFIILLCVFLQQYIGQFFPCILQVFEREGPQNGNVSVFAKTSLPLAFLPNLLNNLKKKYFKFLG